MAKRLIVCLLAFSFIFSAAASRAFSYFEESPWRQKETYNERMTGKLGFGFANLVIGPFEIFQEPYKALSEGDFFWGGVGKGIVNGILDPVGGALQLITFPFTFRDIRLPEGGTDMVY